MPKTFPVPVGAIEVTINDPVIESSFTQDDPSFTIAPVNHSPIANAGADQEITLPTNTVVLTGSASDPDIGGKVVLVVWEIVSGSGTLDSPNTSTTNLKFLTPGTTVVKFTAIDDQGATGSDTVSIVVHEAPVTPPPSGDTLVYSNGFNTKADLDPFGTGQAGNGFIDSGNAFEGAASFRSRPANVSSGIRSEMQGAPTPTKGAMEWYAKYNYFVQNQCHEFQFHPSTSGGSASPGLWHQNGKLVWRNWIKGANQSHNVNYTVQMGVWVHHRIEYQFGSNGYFRHFIDGNLVCDWTGQVGDGSSPYVKIGFNGGFDGNVTEAMKSDINYDLFKVFKTA